LAFISPFDKAVLKREWLTRGYRYSIKGVLNLPFRILKIFQRYNTKPFMGQNLLAMHT